MAFAKAYIIPSKGFKTLNPKLIPYKPPLSDVITPPHVCVSKLLRYVEASTEN